MDHNEVFIEKEMSQTEVQLRESETRYRRLFETAKDGILLLDADSGQITDVNPFLIEMLGYSYNEFIGKSLWEIGPFKDIAASKSAFRELRQKKYIRYDELPLETKNGEKVDVEFVSNIYEVNGQKVIQCNVRDISERKRIKDSLNKANEELSSLVEQLQNHDREMRLINHMNDLLQACKTQEEAFQVISLAVGDLFKGQRGGLAILHDSGHFLETFASWGNEPMLESIFQLDDCWAIRRGRAHEAANPLDSLICRHFVRPLAAGYLCLPLVVQGEMLGLLSVEIPAGMKPDKSEHWRQQVVTIGEGIKLSLSNLKLREIMREQANHDPLTGLFNRRYLNDTLPRELNHARRDDKRTTIAMLDIDHFKHFNDTYGHDAGDLMLRELGRVLRENVRESDIACRFGGEEFVLILLNSALESSRDRLEKINAVVKEMQIHYGEQLLGSMTLSIGIIEASQHEMTVDEILSAADKALYAAKRTGRDRIVAYCDLENK